MYIGLNDFIWLKRGSVPAGGHANPPYTPNPNAEGFNPPANLAAQFTPAGLQALSNIGGPNYGSADTLVSDDLLRKLMLDRHGSGLGVDQKGPNGGGVRERGFAPEGCCSPRADVMYISIDDSDSAAGGYDGYSVTTDMTMNLDPGWAKSTDSRNWLLNMPLDMLSTGEDPDVFGGFAGLRGLSGDAFTQTGRTITLSTLSGKQHLEVSRFMDLLKNAMAKISQGDMPGANSLLLQAASKQITLIPLGVPQGDVTILNNERLRILGLYNKAQQQYTANPEYLKLQQQGNLVNRMGAQDRINRDVAGERQRDQEGWNNPIDKAMRDTQRFLDQMGTATKIGVGVVAAIAAVRVIGSLRR